jgi:hypothetical protein
LDFSCVVDDCPESRRSVKVRSMMNERNMILAKVAIVASCSRYTELTPTAKGSYLIGKA